MAALLQTTISVTICWLRINLEDCGVHIVTIK